MSWVWVVIVEPLAYAAYKGILSLLGRSVGDKLKPYVDKQVGKVVREPKPDTKPTEPPKETEVPIPPPPEEESPIDKLGWNPPDYRKKYREDIIEGIKWEWEWNKDAGDRPRIEFIENLESYCPPCGRRISPNSRLVYEDNYTEAGSSIMPYLRRISIPKYYTYLLCENEHCQVNLRSDLTLDQLQNGIKVEIEHIARDQKEWQAAPERIRAAQEK